MELKNATCGLTTHALHFCPADGTAFHAKDGFESVEITGMSDGIVTQIAAHDQ